MQITVTAGSGRGKKSIALDGSAADHLLLTLLGQPASGVSSGPIGTSTGRRRGRPKGSRNKPKATRTATSPRRRSRKAPTQSASASE